MERPLTDELLAYAAGDIERITALYEHFNKMGYLEEALLPELLSQSERYVAFFRSIGRPSSGNRFWRSALLPLGILRGADEELQVCDCCQRGLSADCFRREEHDGSNKGVTQSSCRVCCFISAKDDYKAKASAKEGHSLPAAVSPFVVSGTSHPDTIFFLLRLYTKVQRKWCKRCPCIITMCAQGCHEPQRMYVWPRFLNVKL